MKAMLNEEVIVNPMESLSNSFCESCCSNPSVMDSKNQTGDSKESFFDKYGRGRHLS